MNDIEAGIDFGGTYVTPYQTQFNYQKLQELQDIRIRELCSVISKGLSHITHLSFVHG